MTSARSATADVDRLKSLLASGDLMHPYLSSHYFANRQSGRNATGEAASPSAASVPDEQKIINDDVCDNFVDLAASLSICCGVTPPQTTDQCRNSLSMAYNELMPKKNVEEEIQRCRMRLASEIGGSPTKDANGNTTYSRRHIVLVLCDGMGNSILQNTMDGSSSSSDASEKKLSFFMENNEPSRLRAVFPSTTPAALTTLATAAWPGRHGMPGWNLRDKKGCDFPGQQDDSNQPVQLLVLSDHIRDARSGELASERGFESWDEVFVEVPWARKLSSQQEHLSMDSQQQTTCNRRRMIYINAHNGDDYQNWTQGDMNERKRKQSDATDFSSWQIGCENAQSNTQNGPSNKSSLFETDKIEETSYDTLGKPEGSAESIEYFRQGIDIALKSIANAERSGDSTFIYLYTAHPDKHMHALGIEHKEVTNVVKGIEREVERFWRVLCDREALMSGQFGTAECNGSEPHLNNNGTSPLDAAVVVTADHGHVTVNTNEMVTLPDTIIDLLEYACIGVHGKGRHAYLHCRAGLQSLLQRRWQLSPELFENFLLLTVDDAIENGLFGPGDMRVEVRPRLGDFIAISLRKKTLVTPSEAERYKTSCQCQGAHGSLLPEEMSIPFILLSPDNQ